MDYHMQFLEFISLLRKRKLSFAVSGISSPKACSIICNFRKLFRCSKNLDYHMQFLEFLSLLQKYGLSYAIFMNSFPFPIKHGLLYEFRKLLSPLKHVALICNFRKLFPFSENVNYHMKF